MTFSNHTKTNKTTKRRCNNPIPRKWGSTITRSRGVRQSILDEKTETTEPETKVQFYLPEEVKTQWVHFHFWER